MTIATFDELRLAEPLLRALKGEAHAQPTPIQSAAIPHILAGRDVLATAQTGTGKTAAFLLPIMHRLAGSRSRPHAPRSLILAPTRELAAQIAERAGAYGRFIGLGSTAIFGGVKQHAQLAAIARAPDILIATPGRLLDLLNQRRLRLDAVEHLVLDEADRMLDMGFRPAVDRLVAACPAERQTLFFSATLDGEAGRVAAAYTRAARRHEHAPKQSSTARIEHRFVAVERDERIEALVGELRGERELALVFVRTKRGADRLVKRLGSAGVTAVAMHGDKSQRQREKALASFEAGRVDTLIATDVAARGIDVTGISHVINFDPPADREGYVHRIGRTGRAGRTGVGITFFGSEHVRDLQKIAEQLRLKAEFRAALG